MEHCFDCNIFLPFCFPKALANEATQFESQFESAFLPPCHAGADKPEDVYKFEDSILYES